MKEENEETETKNQLTMRHLSIVRDFTLLVIFILSINNSYSQDMPTYIPLATTNPDEPWDDLKKIDHYFDDVRIVGMGESTHGTKEFSTMRHRVFRYLVQNHGFNTLFLEADYANCLLANNYIHGGMVDKYDAINNLALWPWMTEEMGDLFEWMRQYNQKNPVSGQLQIIGVDMQKFTTTLTEIDKLSTKYNLPVTDTSIYKPLAENAFYEIKWAEAKQYMALLDEKMQADTSKFSAIDKQKYNLLLRHLSQILEAKKKKKDNIFRDVKMGENILYHLSKDEEIKGLFWAHNYHVYTIFSRNKKTGKASGYAGGILKASLGSQFMCIVQEFDEGSFNAFFKPDARAKDSEPTGYTLGAVTIEPGIENSFGAYFRNTPDDILFIDIKTLTPEPKNYLIQHTIGAQFVPQKDNFKQTSLYNHCTTGCFDAMILIKISTPTALLQNRSN
jgi:erythromycin esterase